MLKKISPMERMLMLGIGFTMALLCVRVWKTDSTAYVFYGWNMLLAIVPILFSRMLEYQEKPGLAAWALIAGWLLFFPNAPYIVTDLFHYRERPSAPFWFDLLIVSSAAWNGIMLGIVSLMQVEAFLSKHMRIAWARMIVFASMVLCGYGIFIGRFLRFNSWNIVTQPSKLAHTSAKHFLRPQENLHLWGFTFLFATMFGVIYFTVKAMKEFRPKQIIDPNLF